MPHKPDDVVEGDDGSLGRSRIRRPSVAGPSMAEYVGSVALTLWGRRCTLAGMKQRTVVIVGFPGLQPLDAVGPFEVFAGRDPGRGRVSDGSAATT